MTDPPNYDLVTAFLEKRDREGKKYAAFAIPVVDGIIHLAVRNTPPHVGLESAIGGKVERGESLVFPDPTRASVNLEILGYETPTSAAVREFFEEAYSRTVTDIDLQKIEIARLGCYDDLVTGVSCYMRVVRVPAWSFHPDPRQIGIPRPLSQIDPHRINPLTCLALHYLRNHEEFARQIPGLELPRYCGPLGAECVFTY